MRRLRVWLGACPYCYGWRQWTGWVFGGMSLTEWSPGRYFRFCQRCGEEQWRNFISPMPIRKRMPEAEYLKDWSHDAREHRREEFDAATWGEFRQS